MLQNATAYQWIELSWIDWQSAIDQRANISNIETIADKARTDTMPSNRNWAMSRGEDFSPHLPLLLHAAVVCLDHEEALVSGHCQQLLTHLLYSLTAYHAAAQNERDDRDHLIHVGNLYKEELVYIPRQVQKSSL